MPRADFNFEAKYRRQSPGGLDSFSCFIKRETLQVNRKETQKQLGI